MKTTEEITNSQDIIDSRDVIARIEHLKSERDDLVSEAEDDTNAAIDEAKEALADWDGDYKAELDALEALASEGEGSPDWSYGEQLIRDTYFTEHAQQLAEDCCEMPRDLKWPFTCIDWKEAADELKQDYMSVSFDGVDYWIRA